MEMRGPVVADVADAYLLLSRKWSRGSVLSWWGPNRAGYVWAIEDAGRYSEEEAKRTELDSWGDAVAVKFDDAMKASRMVVFDHCGRQWLERGAKIERDERARLAIGRRRHG